MNLIVCFHGCASLCQSANPPAMQGSSGQVSLNEEACPMNTYIDLLVFFNGFEVE